MTTPPDDPKGPKGSDSAAHTGVVTQRDDERAALELRLAERGLEVIRQDPEFAAAMSEDAELRALAGALSELDAAMPLFESDRVPETLREAVLADARIAAVRPPSHTMKPASTDVSEAEPSLSGVTAPTETAEHGTILLRPEAASETRSVNGPSRVRILSGQLWAAKRVWAPVAALAAAVLFVVVPLGMLASIDKSPYVESSASYGGEMDEDNDDNFAETLGGEEEQVEAEMAWNEASPEPENPTRPQNRRPRSDSANADFAANAQEAAQEAAPSDSRRGPRGGVGGDGAPSPPSPAAAAPSRSSDRGNRVQAARTEASTDSQTFEVTERERGTAEGRGRLGTAAIDVFDNEEEGESDNDDGIDTQPIGQPHVDQNGNRNIVEQATVDRGQDSAVERANLERALLRDLDGNSFEGGFRGGRAEEDRRFGTARSARDSVRDSSIRTTSGSSASTFQGQLGGLGDGPGSAVGLIAVGRDGGGADHGGGLNGPGQPGSVQSLSQLTNQIGAFSQIQTEQNIVANNFVVNQQAVEGVRTQSATGYWLNTYVPGDAENRLLADRVYADDAAYQLARGLSALERPFDPPTDSALAVTAHGSRARTNGETRMVVQVGLQATERSTGRRPAMSIAVVLDLRAELTSDEQDRVTALLQTLSSMQETGDRISLVVAGEQGGVWIEPGEFRYGTLAVAEAAVANGAEGRFPTESLGLQQALREGGRLARSDDDPNAPLGSSVVVLVTPERANGRGVHIGSLERDAHERSVAGVPTSVVSLAPGVIAEPLALAGGGQRWTLSTTEDAERVATGEIEAVSGIVARAVRLRIRLAPGVRLVDVLGSESLNEQRSERVREAEQAADQRISRSMGIASDRGEDEDGIQIVVPAFRVGDDHTVLLDVIVPGAGPVLDVTVRYKDLVHLNNGIAQTTFSVRSGDPEPLGPLEIAVWEDVANFEVAQRLDDAAHSLGSTGHAAAVANLTEAIALLDGLPAALPGFVRTRAWQDDRDALLQLRQAVLDQTLDPARLADALRFAHAQKLYPMPGTSE
jgi:hypothetical protein